MLMEHEWVLVEQHHDVHGIEMSYFCDHVGDWDMFAHGVERSING